MSVPFIGEIRMGGWNFAPVDWAFCNGQLLSIAEFPALYNLIGTTYGGDGQNNFALPNLQGRVPVHRQTGAFPMGMLGGEEQVTLDGSQIPAHSHSFSASTATATQKTPVGNVPAAGSNKIYIAESPTAQLNAQMISASGSGGGQSHDNMQPYQAVNFIISLAGVYPSPS